MYNRIIVHNTLIISQDYLNPKMLIVLNPKCFLTKYTAIKFDMVNAIAEDIAEP